MHEWLGWVAGVALLAVWFVIEVMTGAGPQAVVAWALILAMSTVLVGWLFWVTDFMMPLRFAAQLLVGFVLVIRLAQISGVAAAAGGVAWIGWGVFVARWAKRSAQSSPSPSSEPS